MMLEGKEGRERAEKRQGQTEGERERERQVATDSGNDVGCVLI